MKTMCVNGVVGCGELTSVFENEKLTVSMSVCPRCSNDQAQAYLNALVKSAVERIGLR